MIEIRDTVEVVMEPSHCSGCKDHCPHLRETGEVIGVGRGERTTHGGIISVEVGVSFGTGLCTGFVKSDLKLIKKANPVITNDFNIGDKVEIVEVLDERANYKVGDRATWTDCFPQADFWRGEGMARKWYKFKLVEEKKVLKNDEMNKEEGMQIEERLLDLYEKTADARLVQEEFGANFNIQLMDMVLADKKKQLLDLAKKNKADREKESE